MMKEHKQLWRPVRPQIGLSFWTVGFARTLTDFWLAFVPFEPLTKIYDPL